MPKSSSNGWTTVSLQPLSGLLDTRSRPADIPPGNFRHKLNLSLSDEAKLCRRDGFGRFYGDALYDDLGVSISNPNHPGSGVFYHNHDHHHQGTSRELITFLFESTDSDGNRKLFDGNNSRISFLNEANGYWTDIAGGMGPGRWRAAELQGYVVFVNGNNILAHQLGTNTTAPITDLVTLGVASASVVSEFNGFMVIMSGVRIRWSDINRPLVFNTISLSGFQDLTYGDEILNAAPLLGALYIFTRRAIWRMTVSGDTNRAFDFSRIYYEPKNQSGCLLYPNTLTSDGQNLWYMSREGIYRYNPFIPAPERDDWLHRGSGVIFKKADTALSGLECDAPVAEYRPLTRELWFSWPTSGLRINNISLVAKIEHKSADIVDHGFATFANFRRTPVPGFCNESQDFLGVSTADWAIKSIGGPFHRQILPIGIAPELDPPREIPEGTYKILGYNSVLRLLIPLGLTDRDKIVRRVLIDDDTADQQFPCVFKVRIGNSYHIVDPNDADPTCSPLWRVLAPKPAQCPDGASVPALLANGLRPNLGTEWACYERGRFLWFELSVTNADGTPAIGGDLCLMRIDWDTTSLPKA